MFNFTLPITKDLILSRVSEEEIFERYLGLRPEFGIMFTNPLRVDNHASCNFNIDRFERIKFHDPGGGFNWDCFNVVEYAFKVNFKEAMKIIATDFGITQGTISDPARLRNIRAKEKVEIRIRTRDWYKVDKEFWFDRYLQRRVDLIALDIFPVSHVWYLRSGVLELFYTHRDSDPCYAYCFGGYDYKLYFPFREKGNKFRQNRGDIIQGLNKLPKRGHILIHTKSYKDVACIRKFSKEFDIHAIASMSETQIIPKEVYTDLKPRFDYHFSLFDFDRAGIRLMRKYEQEYGMPWLMFGQRFKENGIKDFADCLYRAGYEETRELIKHVYGELIG